jgi:glycosyltransferase involved in cell wall biosynthesis
VADGWRTTGRQDEGHDGRRTERWIRERLVRTNDDGGGRDVRRQVLDVELLDDGPPASVARPPHPLDRATLVPGPASVLVRAHGSPLARVTVDLPEGTDGEALLAQVRPLVAEELEAHLREDAGAARSAGTGTCHAWLPVPDPAPSVTVVIPTVGRADLGPCLDSLFAQDYAPFDVVVVDNSRTAQQRTVVERILENRSAGFDRLRCVREPEPGISPARNCGLAVSTAQITVFVDDDVVVDPRWLRALVAAFGAGPDVSCVTGLLLPWQLETAEQNWFEQYGGFGKGFRRRVYDLDEHRGDSPLYPYLPGQYGTGANIAFDTAFLRGLGGFDRVLGGRHPIIGGEDLDVLLRTVLAGGRLVYEPNALMWYQPFREYESLRRQMVIYGRGLSAVILKAALADRRVAVDIARRLPAGLRFLLARDSSKNALKQDFPADLSRRELAGVVSGPFAFAWGHMSRPTRKAHRARGDSAELASQA